MLIAVGEGSWSRAEKRREVNIEVEMPEKQAGWRSKEKGTAASSGEGSHFENYIPDTASVRGMTERL